MAKEFLTAVKTSVTDGVANGLSLFSSAAEGQSDAYRQFLPQFQAAEDMVRARDGTIGIVLLHLHRTSTVCLCVAFLADHAGDEAQHGG